MTVHVGKLTSKAQTTLPKPVRQALGLKPGDALLYRIDGAQVVLERGPSDPHALAAARAAWGPSWPGFAEDWLSPEDEAAFDDL